MQSEIDRALSIRGFRILGVLEGSLGAALYTLILILLALGLRFCGVDLIEILSKVSGHT
jgi:hypothetical protein